VESNLAWMKKTKVLLSEEKFPQRAVGISLLGKVGAERKTPTV